MFKMFEILSLMAKEHKGATTELSLRQRNREAVATRQRCGSGNNVVIKHNREARSSIRPSTKAPNEKRKQKENINVTKKGN